jgi:hypothetical protein
MGFCLLFARLFVVVENVAALRRNALCPVEITLAKGDRRDILLALPTGSELHFARKVSSAIGIDGVAVGTATFALK